MGEPIRSTTLGILLHGLLEAEHTHALGRVLFGGSVPVRQPPPSGSSTLEPVRGGAESGSATRAGSAAPSTAKGRLFRRRRGRGRGWPRGNHLAGDGIA